MRFKKARDETWKDKLLLWICSVAMCLMAAAIFLAIRHLKGEI